MAIPCPGCGRDYDITLFQYGRTVTCTCGAQVGRRMTVEVTRAAGAPRFIADVMLGRLARWLRAIGCDVVYDHDAEDAGLVRRAVDEGRLLLTRDRRLAAEWWIENCMVPASESVMEQLREIVERYDIDWERRLFTRCTLCNELLQRLDGHEVERHVPEGVRERHADFARCPDCGRLYWSGSHTDRMRRRLEEALGRR